VKKEMEMMSVYFKNVLAPMETMINSLGIRGSFRSGDSGAALNPDGAWLHLDEKDNTTCRLVIEFKTPWALPSVLGGNLAKAYRAASLPTASKYLSFTKAREIILIFQPSSDNSPQSPQ
jgi:hypothetical protein